MAVSSPSSKQKQAQQRKDKLNTPSKKEMKSSPAKKPAASPSKNPISSPPKRNSCPGVRVVGGRIYDSQNGKTCHQCRQKTMDFTAACMNMKKDKPCTFKFCHKCLLNRYGENAEEVSKTGDWSCPKCRGICNCSFCMKKRGFHATGQLTQTAKASGYSSVSEMLKVKGPESVCGEKIENDTGSEKETSVVSPRKRGKENSYDGKMDSNSQTTLSSANGVQKKSKKDGVESLSKTHNGIAADINMVKADSTAKDSTHHDEKKPKNTHKTKKHQLPNKHEADVGSVVAADSTLHHDEKKRKNTQKRKKDQLPNKHEADGGSVVAADSTLHHDEKKPKNTQKRKKDQQQNKHEADGGSVIAADSTLHHDGKKTKNTQKTKKDQLPNKLEADVGSVIAAKETNRTEPEFDNTKVKPESDEDCQHKKKNLMNVSRGGCVISSGNGNGEEGNNCNVDIPLPQGIELTTVAGVDIPPEDVGNVLQFLEFCTVFGKVLDLKKGQAECILRDILQSRTVRRGKYSLTVQFIINLLSFILKEQGEGSPELSLSDGESSWTHALRRCITESHDVAKSMDLDLSNDGPDIYESLSSSKKLKLLNFLCDEVLGTATVREWIEEQNAKVAELAKGAREKILAAKDKEKSLKRKMQDDIAKAILAKDGAPLSFAEHDSFVSKIKQKVAEAHAELLDSQGLLSKNKQKCDATRTEPIFLDGNGRVYWRLKCCSDKSDIFLQDVGSGSTLALDEKWFTFDVDEKGKIEQHVSSLRRKRLRAQRLPLVACQDNEAQL